MLKAISAVSAFTFINASHLLSFFQVTVLFFFFLLSSCGEHCISLSYFLLKAL